MQLAESLDLKRLQHDDLDACVLQIAGDAALVAAGGLDAEAADAFAGQMGLEFLPSGDVVGEDRGAVAAMDRDIELGLGGIDSGSLSNEP